MERDLLTPREVAEELRVTERTVYSWLSGGQLKALRAGRFWRIERSEVSKFLSRRQEQAGQRALAPTKSPTSRSSTLEDSRFLRMSQVAPMTSVLCHPGDLAAPLLDSAEKQAVPAWRATRSGESTGLISYRASENAVLCIAGQSEKLLELSHQRRCMVCNNILAHDDARCPGRHPEGPVLHTVTWSERPPGAR